MSARVLLLRLMQEAEQVKDASLLLSAGFQIRHPELYQESVKMFGSWEATLARLVIAWRDKDLLPQQASTDGEQEESSEIQVMLRERSPAADDALWCTTSTGELVKVEGSMLALSPSATPIPQRLFWPPVFGELLQACHQGAVSDVAVFSRKGLYYTVSQELVPNSGNWEQAQTIRQRLELDPADQIMAVLASHRLRNRMERLLHVTAQGKAKATEVSEYPTSIGKNAREAFLLNEGDWPIAVLVGEEVTGLFCASALGQGIHMPAEEIRTMGRKSVGVNVMKLENAQDAVVSAFLTDNVEHLAVITAQGYGKLISCREFRKQGRGGAGMQVLRLNPNDRVVGVLPCQEHSDVLLTALSGQYWRLPSYLFPEMGRAARGKRILEVHTDDPIVGMSILPCAGNFTEPVDM